ncbi:hypothetical protein COT20_00635 [bacterium (Candidatus Gribaldobacteria) CG08_land_8_20_14_0_20_39_15]|uniref:Uncharacterized protein n=1 Tax=bacterium (Candidatus Gribaldobacteria) CG08_land_8_20_14_0_20_39_15 TaxID=2014273 RepID=A0A2M6XV26_9BACT|nr:MAG: hypothetical protein COT20_00635 [bacterium (Candidatus Gribaldobacteria) CG08_land_8_20_14_0_20_39_15]
MQPTLENFSKNKEFESFMSELNQILQYEQQKEKEIAEVRRIARENIQKKEEWLRKKIATNCGLNISESQEIIQAGQVRIKEFEISRQKQQKEEVDGLLRKKSARFEQAVDFIVANFCVK